MQRHKARSARLLWLGAAALCATSCAVYQVPMWWPGSRVEGELRLLNPAAAGGRGLGPIVVYLDSDEPAPVLLAGGSTVVRHDGRRFQPEVVALDRRTLLQVHNDGGLHHRIFWIADGEQREVTLGPEEGATENIALDRLGVARFYCALHEDEHFTVFVVPSHLNAMLDGPGPYVIPSVPPGRWTLKVWAEAVEGPVREVEVRATRISLEPIVLDAKRLVRR